MCIHRLDIISNISWIVCYFTYFDWVSNDMIELNISQLLTSTFLAINLFDENARVKISEIYKIFLGHYD